MKENPKSGLDTNVNSKWKWNLKVREVLTQQSNLKSIVNVDLFSNDQALLQVFFCPDLEIR